MRTLTRPPRRAAHSALARAARRADTARPAAFLLCLAVFALCAVRAGAQPRAEYRAFWVDTFNTTLNNHADILAVVNNAKAAKANAIFAQVRRRGDAWYLNPLVPRPDFTPIAEGFDPLQDLIQTAHAEGIEVHAFVIVGAVWNKNPNFAPSATLGPPTNPNHVFNLHGGYNRVLQRIEPGPDNWLTRSLPPFPTGVTFDGHRFGSDFWIDLGHPGAAAHTADVLTHLVSSYDLDGLHLDRIRYPEFDVPAGQPTQTPANGTNIGYNQTSVARFNARHGRSGNPSFGDPLWMQWRRDQVSNLVRRVYLNAVAVRPRIKVSAALIAFGGGPTTEAQWNSAEAYWRVYQDWRAWTQEGILDIAMPMDYKRDHIGAQLSQFNQWSEWTKNHKYDRSAVLGLGAFVNPVEGTLRQTRRALAPSALGNTADGVIFFSMATSNSPATSGANNTALPNPFSIPANQITLTRSFAEFASGLTTGKSVDGQTLYEDPAANPAAVFAQPAPVPVFSWKESPAKGHAKGFALRADSTPLDTATVTIESLDAAPAPAPRTTATDGGGFYGAVDLAPGRYRATARLNSDTHHACFDVTAGQVADAAPDTAAPETTAAPAPAAPNGANGWYTSDVTIALAAADACAGVASTEYSTDGGATWQPYSAPFVVSAEGTTVVSYRSTDGAGNAETARTLAVKLDKSAPTVTLSANPSVIWPATGQTVAVTISGAGADAVSGLSGVSYVVADEYGSPLSISPRALSGSQAAWAESLAVEARREGTDLDGRLYRVTATVTDAAGRTATASVTVVVPHDQRAP